MASTGIETAARELLLVDGSALLYRSHFAFIRNPLRNTKGETFRHREYPEYKAHRPPMPDELGRQIPIIRGVLRLLGIPIVEQEGVEADDILGTLATEAAKSGIDVWILTSDKDFFQIVSDRIRLLGPRGHGAAGETIDRAGVKARYGVDPEQM